MNQLDPQKREFSQAHVPTSNPPGEIGKVYEGHVDFTIVGGTGRFEHAVGGGEMTRYIAFAGFGVPVW